MTAKKHKFYNPLLGDVDTFVAENKGLVGKIVKQCMNKTSIRVEYEDLFQEGLIGLLKAYEIFDGRGAFSTIAFYCIRNQIKIFIRDKAPFIRLPAHLYELTGKILSQKLTDKPAEEIAKELNTTVESVNYALKYLENPRPSSLNVQLSDDNVDIITIIGEDFDFSGMVVKDFIDTLSKKEKITLSYISLGYSHRAAAESLGVSRASIYWYLRDIKNKAQKYFEVTA